MSVTIYDQPKPTARAWLQLQNPALELANAIADTDFVTDNLRGKPGAITACILYGDEVGLGPMQSLAKISVINGRPTLEAEALRALVLKAGHDIWIEDSTITKCTVAGRRKDSDNVSRITWTMDDAKRANLAGKPNYRLYPREMLLARASAALCRAVFSDAIGGLAATEEMEDDPAGTAPAISNGIAPIPELTPPPTKRKRRANVTAAEPKPEEEEPPPPEPDPPAPEPEGIDEGTRKRMMQLFRERGFNTSEQRHAFTTFMLGRTIESSIELTPDDAAQLITILEAEPAVRAAPPPDER